MVRSPQSMFYTDRLKIIQTHHDSASAMIFRSWCLLAPGHILKIEARVQIPYLFYMKNPIPHPPESHYYQIPRREGKGVKCPGEYLGGMFWFLS